MFIATCEAIFFSLNSVIVLEMLFVMDIGGAMTIHMFGAYFGLAATFFFESKRAIEDKNGKCGGSYQS